jgi:cytochrome c556
MGGGGGAPTTVNPEPMLLSETGLYMDTVAGVVAPDVLEFEPQFRLWSDGSLKKRWVKLPAGQQINTSNMNFWQYPTDTKLFKEFTRDGVRVETRLLWKRGAGDWYMMAYKWNAEQTEATAVPDGELDASGTAHDIPSQEDCGTCHGAMRDKALGFTAVSLAHGAEVPGLTLDDLVTMGVLSNPPAAPVATPTDSVARAAMGYLHANCGMCHNQRSTLPCTIRRKLRCL